MKIFNLILAIFIMFVSIVPQAWCDHTLRGILLEVNAEESELIFKPTNLKPSGGIFPIASEIRLKVSEDTEFDGISNLSELEAGDVLIVDADNSHSPENWYARTISRL